MRSLVVWQLYAECNSSPRPQYFERLPYTAGALIGANGTDHTCSLNVAMVDSPNSHIDHYQISSRMSTTRRAFTI